MGCLSDVEGIWSSAVFPRSPLQYSVNRTEYIDISFCDKSYAGAKSLLFIQPGHLPKNGGFTQTTNLPNEADEECNDQISQVGEETPYHGQLSARAVSFPAAHSFR